MNGETERLEALARARAKAETAIVRAAPSPDEYTSMKMMAQDLAKSRVAGANNPADMLLLMVKAYELGMPLTTALTDLYIVDGKPVCNTHLMTALIHRSGKGYIEIIEEQWDPEKKIGFCHAVGHRTAEPGIRDYAVKFTWADASRIMQGGKPLTSKSNWQNYPRQMMRARAKTEIFRELWVEELMGVGFYAREEMEDVEARRKPPRITKVKEEAPEEGEFVVLGPEDTIPGQTRSLDPTLGPLGTTQFKAWLDELLHGNPECLTKEVVEAWKEWLMAQYGTFTIQALPTDSLPDLKEWWLNLVSGPTVEEEDNGD